MIRTHFGQHDDCFGCKLASIQFGNVEPPPQRLIEHQRDRDLPAYKRLRDQGLQPKSTKGCYELESRAHTQFEIDHHGLVERSLWNKSKSVIEDVTQGVREGMRAAQELGYTAQDVKEQRDKAKK